MASDKSQILLPRRGRESGPFSINAPGYEKVEGETLPYVSPKAKNGLISKPSENVSTIFELVKYSAEKFGDAKCAGSRELIKNHVEERPVKKTVNGKHFETIKEWTFYEYSGYTYLSFNEYRKLTNTIGSGLRHLGIEKSDVIHLFGPSSLSWLSTAHGAVSQSITIATAYETLGVDGVRASLVEVSSKAIYVAASLLGVLEKCLSDATNLRHIIYKSNVEIKPEVIDNLKRDYPDRNFISYEELKKLGESNSYDPTPPDPQDVACIMYTSGTSSSPKGVVLKHEAVIASVAGLSTAFGDIVGPGDSVLAYLPPAHIFEFMLENFIIFMGMTIGYGSIKTLTDISMRSSQGDLKEFKPTVLVGVPAIFEAIKKAIIGKLSDGSFLLQKMFWGALGLKKALLSLGLPGHQMIDSAIFPKLKDLTGGRTRFIMTGGGPIAKETQEFLSYTIAPMTNGYGLTETGGMGALNNPLHWTPGVLGEMPVSIEVKLVDYPEAGYYTNKATPQGEIYLRGPCITGGYYENEEYTKEVFTADGWFKTGDIGEFDHEGNLKMIDRKKNLVKNINGEYLALEKLESIYRTSPLIMNQCVCAFEQRPKPILIAIPAEPALVKFASSKGIEGSLDDLVQNEKLNALVLSHVQQSGREGGLAGFEIIDAIVLVNDEWNADNGMTTASQKIKRREILLKYQGEVDKIVK